MSNLAFDSLNFSHFFLGGGGLGRMGGSIRLMHMSPFCPSPLNHSFLISTCTLVMCVSEDQCCAAVL